MIRIPLLKCKNMYTSDCLRECHQVELQEQMPVVSQPASVTYAVRTPTVIVEEDNEQLQELEAGDASSSGHRNTSSGHRNTTAAAAADLSDDKPVSYFTAYIVYRYID